MVAAAMFCTAVVVSSTGITDNICVVLCSRGTSLCLAILHPRKLSVCTLQAVGSSYLQLSKIYEHALDHTAADLAYGPFGGVTGGNGGLAVEWSSTTSSWDSSIRSPRRKLHGDSRSKFNSHALWSRHWASAETTG